MGWRFHRIKTILPGVRLNLSKSGVSVSFGVRGLHHTIGRTGTRTTIGLPGSGLSYTSYSRHRSTPKMQTNTQFGPATAGAMWLILMLVAVVGTLLVAGATFARF